MRLYAGSFKNKFRSNRKPKPAPPQVKPQTTITEEDKKLIEQKYKENIAITDTASYLEKINMEILNDEFEPFLCLFDSEEIKKEDLVGFDPPYGLVPRDKYELWKLCGHVCDPQHPMSSQSLTTRIFTQRLFGDKDKVTRDEFNHTIEYKMRFYTPGYGDIFYMDKIRCWRGWLLVRDCQEGPEDIPNYTSIYPVARQPNEVTLSKVIRSLNSEVNRQGVHPALLDMFWNFFTSDKEILTRHTVTYKLNWVIDRLKNLLDMEGIHPDAFYKIFFEPAKKALLNFDKEAFAREQERRLDFIKLHDKLISENAALRKRNRILKAVYNSEMRNLYKIPIPKCYVRYERRRLAGYYNLLAEMHARQQRRRELPKELRKINVGSQTKKEKKPREKKASRRNKRLGRG
ncbi:hypothetical protein BEWA_030890 [Theileria equi strain WA]|uniref:Uncharacterized protein n=1 Tax=Theileria equi strain WA TaxID=1537102 RepID=L0AYY9_THEEQ|nr:hypothetical protein BEWA_030890 [Theileria equi strain WA]AFZ80236.1 hypothetical protein BEWA_030890 [Theileria equi strain WA]|eukprot:XP_004829902.1 hypothetical protein BEWA_030890 [Theileria equi strain WA]